MTPQPDRLAGLYRDLVEQQFQLSAEHVLGIIALANRGTARHHHQIGFDKRFARPISEYCDLIGQMDTLHDFSASFHNHCGYGG